MAKKEQKLSFGDLAKGLQENKLAMNPAIQAQIDAAMAAPDPIDTSIVPSKSSKTDSNLASLNSNLAKLTKAIEANTRVLDSKSKITQGKGPAGPSQDVSETDIENLNISTKQTKLLEKIEENTRPDKSTRSKDEEEQSGFKIGGILTAIALALGTAAGIFLGQLKAFMLVAKGMGKVIFELGKFVKNLIPESVRASILNSFKYIRTFFSDIITKLLISVEFAFNNVKDFFKNRFGRIFIKFVDFIADTFSKIGSVVSKIVGAVKSLGVAITKFFAPIGEALGVIKTYSSTVGNAVGKVSTGMSKFFGFFKSIGEFFTNVIGKLGAFSAVFGAVTKIVSKLAFPITIIMGVYEALVGAIDGFTEGGLVGGIAGFVKGAWNSIVSSFLDLIKDMVSWVLGAFGFDEAEKWLDSFTFKDIFNDFWDMVFKPFKMLQDFIMNLEIPKFSIPLLGEFGPYKIGGSDTAPASTKKSSSKSLAKSDEEVANKLNKENEDAFAELDDRTKYNALGQKITPPVKSVSPPAEANKVYKQSAENKEADKQIPMTKSTNVVNAPTQVNNQTQNALFKRPIRNEDNTLSSWQKTKYA